MSEQPTAQVDPADHQQTGTPESDTAPTFEPKQADHPVGAEQAAENEATESPA